MTQPTSNAHDPSDSTTPEAHANAASSSTSSASSGGAYDPRTVEPAIYELWETRHVFRSVVDKDKTPYTIVIPPPNVTGALHLGHALNNTIQDAMIRYHRQAGFNACWIPGTDHAGIATQSVVEKRLFAQEGKTRHDLGRQEMVRRIWDWKAEYERRILSQLKKLGCSCDWDRTAFTMDDNLSAAVRHVFIRLFKDGLIYRGKRLINWSVGIRTALSNDELEHKIVKTNFWHLKYPIAGGPKCGLAFIEVATTRPETMLGDTAVCVHPDPRAELQRRLGDSSESVREAAKTRLDDAETMARLDAYAQLIGETVELPLTGRRVPIIGDPLLADPAKGTGAVKVTPAHDPNDYACGLRNNLPMINILNDDGTLNHEVPETFRGQFAQTEGRKAVLDALKAGGFLGKIEDLEHSVAHCYRSGTVVEPYLSDQWFVKMAPLVELARKAVQERRVRFVPAARERLFFNWLDSTPDWCISRQLWWGHRIPVWYNADTVNVVYDSDGDVVKIEGDAEPILPPSDDPNAVPDRDPKSGSTNLVQDPDVLDTWFSSQLWPLSTLGWPRDTPDLRYYYPTNLLATARDIIALWVARMIMMGEKFSGEFGKTADERQPFHDVYIHGTIQDERGDIMSKSRGNGFDPVRAIDGGAETFHATADLGDVPRDRIEHYPAYGADALRYGLMSMCSGGQDVKLSVVRAKREGAPSATNADGLPEYDVSIPRFEEGRRFCNKIWQASTGVVLRGLEGGFAPIEGPSPYIEDRWFADRLHRGVQTITRAIREYELATVCDEIYRLFWDDFCSFYLEILKPRLWGDDGERSQRFARTSLLKSLDTLLRLMHPIMPFVSERIWQELRAIYEKGGVKNLPPSLAVASWPDSRMAAGDAEAARLIEASRGIVNSLNAIRAEQPAIRDKRFPLVLITGPESEADFLDDLKALLPGLAKLARVERFSAAPRMEKPTLAAAAVVGALEIYVPLANLIDVPAERARLEKEVARLQEFIAKLEKKLGNANYTANAPADVVQRDREKLAEQKEALARIESNLHSLGH